MPSVLFVCTANICRSPMASAILSSMVASSQQGTGWRIESAGTMATEGRPVSEFSRQVMKSRGLDISGHRSQGVSAALLGGFNLILTMERMHKEILRVEFPQYAEQIYLLSEMAGLNYEIHDPFGGALQEYEEAAGEITTLLTRGMARIKELAA